MAGVTDLDGDGRREVIAVANRGVHILNGLTGQLRWSLPETAFDTDAIRGIARVVAVDVTGEEVPDLYITDGGCSGEGTGRGVVYTFTGPEFGTQLATIVGTRVNGRCSRWQTIADIDGDRRPEIIVTDGNGLNAYDLVTGQLMACGTLEAAPSNGPLPTLHGGGEDARWFVFLNDRIVSLAVRPDDNNVCPTPLAFVPVFETPRVDGIRPEGSAFIAFPEVGSPAILTSVWTADTQSWSVIIYGPNGQRLIADNAALLATIPDGNGQHTLLVRRRADAAAGTHSGPCEIIELTENGDVMPGEALGICEPTKSDPPMDRTLEFSPPYKARIRGQEHRVIRQWTDGQSTAELTKRLLFLGPERRQFVSPAGIQSIINTEALVRDTGQPLSIAFTTESGRIGTLNHEAVLTRTGPDNLAPPLQRAIGSARTQSLVLSGRPHLLTVTNSGYLSLTKIQESGSVSVWGRSLGLTQRGLHSVKLFADQVNGRVVSRYPVAGENAIAGRKLSDGTLLWVHANESHALKTMRSIELGPRGNGQTPLVLRYDRQFEEGAIIADADCGADFMVGEPRVGPDPECPEIPILRRVISAHDIDNGRCLWRSVIEPTTPCSGPGNQIISVVNDRVFVTETRGLVALHSTDGTLAARRDLGRIHGTTGRGGGRVIPGGERTPFIRVGGNGPPEAYADDLQLQWRADPIPNLRSQSWIGRNAVAVGENLWTTPGTGWPLYRYSLADGSVVERIGLKGGIASMDPPMDERFADVEQVIAMSNVDGEGNPGVMATTDEGMIYALLSSGVLAWSRAFNAAVGRPVFFEETPGFNVQMAMPMGRGQIDIFGPSGPTPTPLVWDLSCPVGPRCDDANDIDDSPSARALCAQWTPVAGIDGYQYRIVRIGGVPITPWIDSHGATAFDLMVENLSLGAQYRAQVRTYLLQGDTRLYSTPSTSDGVYLSNASAPVVTLSANTQQLVSARGEIELRASAQDDVNLAGWRLDIVQADTGGHVRRIGGGPLSQSRWTKDVVWLGSDGFDVLVAPGNYRAELSVIDRTGNEGAATIDLLVCDGECP